MPKIKSAKKRVKQNEKRRVVNQARKSAVKTAIKKVIAALDENKVVEAKDLLVQAQSALSRARGKGVMHRNTVARKMSRLAKKVNESQKVSAN